MNVLKNRVFLFSRISGGKNTSAGDSFPEDARVNQRLCDCFPVPMVQALNMVPL
jgi:hypothetical protein